MFIKSLLPGMDISEWIIVLILLAFFCNMIRVGTNIQVWNKIYKTNFKPFGGSLTERLKKSNVKTYSFFIFWWILRDDDSTTLSKAKKGANILGVISALLNLGLIAWLLVIVQKH